ncbi:penicillin-binding protein 1A [Isoalcanivorax beigongshangi]|uniref:Penicillin-binding protein 1A n=1 Tax=Isoalcanivorax beigongshangi TaxID=3238810 RepID=A0ABV4AMA0_9GAMM
MRLLKFWLPLLCAAALLGASAVVMLLSASYLYLGPHLPPADQLREVTFQVPLRIYTADGELMAEYGEQRRTPVRYEDIPPAFVNALISAEDDRFFEHGGVDFKGLTRAATELLRYRQIRSGGSTITMQVARNFFLSADQTFLRKFNEIMLALQIEDLLTKEEIFELYANKIFLGHRAYGIEAAAQVYYGRSIDELTLPELVMIAGLPKAPSAFNPIANPRRALERRNWILGRMLRHERITQAEFDAATAAPNTASVHSPQLDIDGAYVAEMARQQLFNALGERIYTDGIRVITTLRADMQRAAVSSLQHGLQNYDERHGWRGAEAKVAVDDLPPLGSGIADDGLPNEAAITWARAALRGRPRIGDLDAAVVAQVGAEQAQLVLSGGRLAVLNLKQASWARPYQTASRVGNAPEQLNQLLSVGDVVRLRPVKDGDHSVWRLAQVPAAQGALVGIDPHSGAILALQGGYSFSLSHYNRVTQAHRQAGSVFKPFVYAAGLETGITPATIFNDAPVVFQSADMENAWRPTGASSRFYGPTRVREALYRSLNLVSVRLLQQIGLNQAFATLRQFGLPTERFARDLSLALGSATVTPMDMAVGYAVFANGGYLVEPWFIQRIEDKDGELLWQAPQVVLCEEQECGSERHVMNFSADIAPRREPSSSPIATDAHAEPPARLSGSDSGEVWRPRTLDGRTAWLMDSMLQDVVNRGTAAGARSLQRRDLAGKTGSTNDHLDAWFSGYSTGGLVAISWVGFDQPSTLGWGEYGGKVALPIWIDFMSRALKEVPEKPLPQPPGIVSARINPATGLRAAPGASDAIFEYFREENLPDEDTRDLIPGYSGDEEQVLPEELF